MPQACGLHLTEEIKNSSEVLANLKIIKPEKIGGRV
jgi:hypothetical protein